MRGFSRDTGFLINIGRVDGLRTIIKNSNIVVHERTIKNAYVNDLHITIKTLKNPINLNNNKIKFILVKITDWTLLNCSLSRFKDIYKEFFSLIKQYPHKIYIYQNNLGKMYSSLETLEELSIPKFHLFDYIVNSRFYRIYANDAEVRENKLYEEELFYSDSNNKVRTDEQLPSNYNDTRNRKKKTFDYSHFGKDDFWESLEQYKNSDFIIDQLLPEDYISVEELKGRLDNYIDLFKELDLNLIPYENLDEMNSEILEFLQNIKDNTVFELFLSNDEFLSREFDKFIDLFKYYLSNIRKINCQINKISTATAIKYRFNSKELSQETFFHEMDDFKSFLEFSELENNPIITSLNKGSELEKMQYSQAVKEITKEWRRLKIDIQIATERKMLDFKEYYLNKLIDTDSQIELSREKELFKADEPIEQISSIYHVNANNVTIYQQNQLKNIDKVINAENMTYNESDKELIQYFVVYSNSQISNQLKKYLDELKDINTKPETKKTLKSKLSSFLLKNIEKIGEAGVTELIKYLTSLLIS